MIDTIFALATAPGRGAIAVIRLSGPKTGHALRLLSGKLPRPRRASSAILRSADGAILDSALALWFPAPRSYTGEDCAELQVHGGVAVVDGVTEALLALGLRLAEPGEFTRRAFENGKLDLDQAEAVADLIDAESAGQARQAIGQLQGALGRRYQGWRGALLNLLAQLEAAVDFPDEDIPLDVQALAAAALAGLIGELDAALADGDRGRRVRNGYRIAVMGATNAGKSSLINVLSERDVAIVTGVAGTTRDVIEVPLVLCGYRVVLADTAGVRSVADPIEAEGVRRAGAWAEGADLRLWVVDQSGSAGDWRAAAALARRGDICLMNKSDLPPGLDAEPAMSEAVRRACEILPVSALSGNVETVRAALAARVVADLAGSDFPAATRARHLEQLRIARQRLGEAGEVLGEPELAAESVRLAARALERISGRVGAEDVLGQVFASFCIGK